ncbi:MAG: DUF4407 domain-containing protein [Chitinophagales bacterium]|nr:DUF4407 domain-containing protein [Chitinophagales bacterium]
MTQKTNNLNQNTNTTSNQSDSILWWFSTAVKDIIKDCTSDSNKYKIIGVAVAFTWLYATLAWTYFWSTNLDNPILYILLGIFMGGFVLAIDRVLISSINKVRNNILAIILRIAMAICLGAFLAQPIVMLIYSSDIDREIPLLIDQQKMEKKTEIEKLFETRKAEILKNKASIDSSISTKAEEVESKNSEYLKEIDGTGGSGNYGIAGIAKAKKQAYNDASNELEQLKSSNKTALDNINNELAEINNNINERFADYEKNINTNGFLIRHEALQSLLAKDKTNALRQQYYLLIIILTLFELIPIISKLFLSSPVYDSKLNDREQYEIQLSKQNIEKELTLKESYNETANQHDIELIKELFIKSQPERKTKIETLLKHWQSDDTKSFDDLWQSFKAEILSKEEN